MMSDFERRVPLEALDPGSRDPGFWLRFHSRVMGEAQTELARRRMAGDLGVVDVLFAWRRALVPMTLLAAALAGILLLGHDPQPPMQLVALEEVLAEDLNLLPIHSVLNGEGGAQAALFAMADEGF
jgi:hypothetical protein